MSIDTTSTSNTPRTNIYEAAGPAPAMFFLTHSNFSTTFTEPEYSTVEPVFTSRLEEEEEEIISKESFCIYAAE